MSLAIRALESEPLNFSLSFPEVADSATILNIGKRVWARNQKQRRSTILARTRYYISVSGLNDFSMRALAGDCGVAVQTLYNLFGSRSDIIMKSVTEYIDYIVQLSLDTERYPNAFFGVSEIGFQCAEVCPEYIKRITLEYFSGEPYVYESVRDRYTTLLAKALKEMQARGQIISTKISTRTIAGNIFSIYATGTLDWARGYLTGEDLRYELATRIYSVMVEYLSPEYRREAEAWVMSIQSRGNGRELSS